MDLSFTTHSISNNSSNSVYLDLTLTPATPIIQNENMLPGDTVSALINIANTGTVDTYYYLSVNWYANKKSNRVQASRLANTLEIEVETFDPYLLYSGKLVNLIDQPIDGRLLTVDTGNEDLSFTLKLPVITGSQLAGIGLLFDFIFVAT
ncbi:MAG: hypothetical protein ACOCQ2_02910 [Halanaerobiales bacterium]